LEDQGVAAMIILKLILKK